MAKLIGRGRYGTETYPEAARSSPGGGGIPLSRTFFVGVNPSPTPDGSIGNPFPDPITAAAAIPPATDITDELISWAIICAPGVYQLPGNIVLPKRAVSLTCVSYGIASTFFGEAALFVNAGFTDFVDVTVQAGSFSGSGTAAFEGIIAGNLNLDVTAASTAFAIALSNTNFVKDLLKLGANNAFLTMLLVAASEITGNAVQPAPTDNYRIQMFDSQIGNVAGSLSAGDSFVGSFQPIEAQLMPLGHTQIAAVLAPPAAGPVVRFDACDITGSVSALATPGTYVMDSATLGTLIANVGPAAVDGIPLTVMDATASQADFTPIDGNTGDVTLGPPTHTIQNLVLMAPAVAQNCFLPDALSWQIPSGAGAGGRSLYIRNRGAGVINVVPLGADTTEVATVAAGTTLVLTPFGTEWTKVLIGN